MLEIRQSESHTTNKRLYQLADARPVSAIIRERQLQFMGHCLRMSTKDSRISASRRHGRGRLSYIDQISAHLCSDKQIELTATEITAYARDCNKLVAASKKPGR
jgi:hypothetical protein